MKVSGALFLVLLIALAIVMVLRVKEVQHVQDDIGRMMPHLEEQGVEKTVMRRREAQQRIDELEALCTRPEEIKEQLLRLREIASEAASWAAGAPAPSAELTAAVAIRAAADALREYGVRPSESSLGRARAKLVDARTALQEQQSPGTAINGLRDRMQNLEQAQREHLQELEEGL